MHRFISTVAGGGRCKFSLQGVQDGKRQGEGDQVLARTGAGQQDAQEPVRPGATVAAVPHPSWPQHAPSSCERPPKAARQATSSSSASAAAEPPRDPGPATVYGLSLGLEASFLID